MADFTDRIRLIVETVTEGASSSLKGVGSEVTAAEGTVGKFKAAASGAFSFITANAPLAGAAIATGVAAFVKDAVGDFQSLALEAGDAAVKMGMTVDQASRWLEVSDDMGVSTEAVATAAGRLNKEADQGKLAKYGIDAHDANDRLLQTLDYLNGIPDSAERARAGADLLGKGWQSLAPLIESAKDVRGRLDDVSAAKVINPEELEKARQFRDTMDTLNDYLDDLKLTIGGAVVPVLNDLASALANTLGPLDDLVNAIPGMGDAANNVKSPIGAITEGLANATDGSLSFTDRLKGLGATTLGQIPVLSTLAGGIFDVDKKQQDATASGSSLAGQVDATGNAIEDTGNQAEDAAAQIDQLSGSFLKGESSALRAAQQTQDLVGKLDAGKTPVTDLEAKFVDLANTMVNTGGTAAAIDTLTRLKQYVTPGSELDRYLDGLIGNLQKITTGGTGTYTVNVKINQEGGVGNVPYGPAIPHLAPNMAAAPDAPVGVDAFALGDAPDNLGTATVSVPGRSSSGPVYVTNVTNHWPAGARPADVVAASNRWTSTRGTPVTVGATGL